MDPILEILEAAPSFQEVLDTLKRGKRRIALHGLVLESTGHFAASLGMRWNRPVFVVVESAKRARELTDALEGLLGDRAVFLPEEAPQYFRTDTTISPVRRARWRVLHRLHQGEALLVVTTFTALRRPVTPPRRYQSGLITMDASATFELADLTEHLVGLHYQRTTTVEHPGEFALRGDILDVFSPAEEKPVRLEFFDTEIDRMTYFDVETQRSTEPLSSFTLTPVESVLLSAEDLSMVYRGIEKDLESKHGAGQRERAEEKFHRILEVMQNEGTLDIPDLAAAYLDGDAIATPLDYLPEEGLILFEDVDRIMEEERARDQGLANERLALFEQGELLATHLKRARTSQDLLEAALAYQTINLTQILKTERTLVPDALLELRSIEMESFRDQWPLLVERLHAWKKQGERILLLAGSARERLAARLTESGVAYRLSEEDALFGPGDLVLSEGTMPRGFRYPDSRLILLTRNEIFGTQKRRKTVYKPKKKSDLLNFQDLVVGDYVVHDLYGIGEYLGTETIEYSGLTKDFIKISYRGTDALYVPTDEMDRVTKYIGSGQAKPVLSSLGGSDWKRAKEKAVRAVDAIADDLVLLYAKRAKIKGYAFGPDSPWQKEFEDAFPYEDTPSQARATIEIKHDMEKDRPMDRLLCGDVGYGKTEVALRAAFKAIMDGKQVAFLAPTTILVQQHYQTMLKRFQNVPVRIEFLSRFKTPEQQKRIVEAVARGEVDMIVGTHRLLSKDIHFHDLGLLVIDEEQRFGVKDKEKMKKMKESVDVLTLSATPIPRTLQLSLTGIRDMSLLEEPPEERYPTITYVMEDDPGVLREAIQREMDRNGQIYVVHNRVHDIHQVHARLQKLVPEASIIVAHGQMSIRELERVMETFVAGEADILLATTIIETGMDIPNVNTLIVRHSDRMGLSQLYQLKGRIGRSDRQSYAYFTYQRAKVLTEISEKRLKAIRDFTEFGAGYKIAMRDLELRGAGNLLGESQSGHIASVGYELYVRLLEEAVNRAKGLTPARSETEINVDLKISAFIPESYIPQSNDKMTMYRQIASIETEADSSTIIDELIDRYGDPPESVTNLIDIVLIKRWAGALGFSRVKETADFVELRYEPFERFSVEQLKEISDGYQGPLTFDFQKTPMFKIARYARKVGDVKRLLKWMDRIINKTN